MNRNLFNSKVASRFPNGVLSIFLVILIAFSSCGVYIPQLVEIPLISEKNEASIEGGISLYGMFAGSVSYGISKKIAVQTFLNKSGEGMFYFQNAAAYYKNLGGGFVTEFWGGYGFGFTDQGNHDRPSRLKGRYNFTFAQIDIGRKNEGKAHVDYGIGLKGGWLRSDLTDYNYFNDYQYPNIGPPENRKLNCFILEPDAFLRLGGEHFKVSFKVGGCKRIQKQNPETPLPYNNINYGIGFNFRF